MVDELALTSFIEAERKTMSPMMKCVCEQSRSLPLLTAHGRRRLHITASWLLWSSVFQVLFQRCSSGCLPHPQEALHDSLSLRVAGEGTSFIIFMQKDHVLVLGSYFEALLDSCHSIVVVYVYHSGLPVFPPKVRTTRSFASNSCKYTLILMPVILCLIPFTHRVVAVHRDIPPPIVYNMVLLSCTPFHFIKQKP